MPTEPERDVPQPKRSWWQTVPGMLTALAAVLTALGGLLVALRQAGLLGRHDDRAAVPASTSASPSASPPASPGGASGPPAAGSPAAVRGSPAGDDGGYQVVLPSRSSVTLRGNRGVGTYQVLGVRVSQRSAKQLTLTLSLRLTNAGPNDIGFWNDSFRLLVDGVPRSPTNRLIDAVDARSAKEADIEFDLPVDAKAVELQITNGETGSIPLALQAAR